VRFLDKKILIIVLVAFGSFAAGLITTGAAANNRAETLRNLERFSRVYQKIIESYVEEEDSRELVDAAIEAMVDQLDPFSAYMDQAMLEDLLVKTRGEFGGLGIIISVRDEFPTVVSPIEDTPAARLGIRGGDKIVEIEGESTRGWGVEDAVDKLRGPEGTVVNIGIQRFGSDEILPYPITRAIIPVESVPYHFVLGDDIGYIRCTNFGERTAEELRAAIVSLEAEGIKGLILDLRNNPGGLLESAKDVSDLFLEAGQIIVSTRGRDGRRLQEIYATRGERFAQDYPLVVMINENSASASEIVAGAVQDWDRGLVVGRSSYGKGSVQSIFSVSEVEALKLTTAKYYTPSGRCIHKDENDERFDPDTNGDGMVTEAELEALQETELAREPESPVDSELPLYATLKLQRPVRGGGGIMPDIVLAADEITDVALDLERRSAFFNFAVELLAEHPVDRDFQADAALLTRFRGWLAAKEIEVEDQAFSDNEDYIRMALQREVLYKQFGSVEAYRSTLGMDRVLQETLSLLRDQSDLDTLFARSSEHSGEATVTRQ
jgi:carboxyl-terminal processing protease